jgi:septum site-determining protein MinC
VTLLRGRLDGLEVALGGRDLEEALEELQARLVEQPSFYRGSSAVANFGAVLPTTEQVKRLRQILSAAGVELRAFRGSNEDLGILARDDELAFEQSGPSISQAGRSLVADFEGARNDIAERRKRGESSVRRVKAEPSSSRSVTELRLVETPPGTLYHTVTLRGGQTLHHTGNIVVVGDVNPGAELIATGDIVVFGRLAGTAHAGAQGDETARIYAIDLTATQLRIATFIAAEDGTERRGLAGPEAALARDGQIVVVSLARLDRPEIPGATPA